MLVVRKEDIVSPLFFCSFSPHRPVTAVACHVRHSVVSDAVQSQGLQPTRFLCPWHSPGKNTDVGTHFFSQGIFLTHGSNPGLLHCRQILYRLSHHCKDQSKENKGCFFFLWLGKQTISSGIEKKQNISLLSFHAFEQ